MKELYLDIMEKALSAYTEERIWEYIEEVKRDGLTEHGFPRLGANIGILMAHGRQLELKSKFIEIIDLCLDGFAHPINSIKSGNNFAVREVCHAIMELGKTNVIDCEQLEIWKKSWRHWIFSQPITRLYQKRIQLLPTGHILPC